MSLLEVETVNQLADLKVGTRWPEVIRLMNPSEEQPDSKGYIHTLSEILQQPGTWRYTGDQIARLFPELRRLLDGIRTVILSGSGSSEYAGETAFPGLQRSLDCTVQVIGSGSLVTHGMQLLPPARPALMVSFGRSGDSPESARALSQVLAANPDVRHLVFTCNVAGKMAVQYREDARVAVVALEERTNDRSLVMTSSFTNMVLAAMGLGMLDRPDEYVALSRNLAERSEAILEACFSKLPSLAATPFSRTFYLSGALQTGAARESALKMMEMTAGRVMTASETYLGLRHGPMSAVHPDTLVVCFLSSEPAVRAYECDLIRELSRKKLGMGKLIVGSEIPASILESQDVVIEYPASPPIADHHAGLLHVLAGQVLAFHRCLQEGLHPDHPSESGVINRVVEEFSFYDLPASSSPARIALAYAGQAG